MNGLNNFDKTEGEYSLAPIDDLIRLWKSKVKVRAGLCMWWWRHPHQRWCIEVRQWQWLLYVGHL